MSDIDDKIVREIILEIKQKTKKIIIPRTNIDKYFYKLPSLIKNIIKFFYRNHLFLIQI